MNIDAIYIDLKCRWRIDCTMHQASSHSCIVCSVKSLKQSNVNGFEVACGFIFFSDLEIRK